MAKRFTETVDIQGVNTSTGSAQAALSLADQLETFKNRSIQAAGAEAVQRGETSGRKVEADRQAGISAAEERLKEVKKQNKRALEIPEFREAALAGIKNAEDALAEANEGPTFKRQTFIGGIEKSAHNKALKGAYLASLSNDITESVNRVETENASDLLKFNDSIAGLTKGILNGVDPGTRLEVATFMDGQVGDARTRVHRRSIKLAQAQATSEMQAGLDRSTGEAVAKARAGDMTGSAVALLSVRIITQTMQESGSINANEAATLQRTAEFGAARENKVGAIADMMEAGDVTDAINAIDDWRDNIPKGFTVDEHDEVSTALLSEFRTSLSLDAKIDDIAMKELTAEQGENFVAIFSGVISGQVDTTAVMAAAKQKLISMTDAVALVNVQNSRGAGVNDWDVILDIQERIGRGEDVRRVIGSAAGRTLTGIKAEQLMKSNTTKQDSLKTGVAKTLMDTPDAKREKKYIETVMGQAGMFEKFDPKMKRNLAEARREFEDRVLAGELPRTVSDEIIAQFDVFDQDVGLLYGDTNNLEEAQETLGEDFDNDLIDETTYNTQFNNIQRRRVLVDARKLLESERKADDARR